jgi:xanthine dehydrogenase small subunit
MKSPKQVTPDTITEALEFLAREGSRASIVFWDAQTLEPPRISPRPPEYLLNVGTLSDLHAISLGRRRLRVGAAVALNRLIESKEVLKHAPLLPSAAKGLPRDSPRTSEPLGTHLSSPLGLGFMLPALIVHRGEVILRSLSRERFVPVADFVSSGGRAWADPDELLTALELEPMGEAHKFSCQRLSGGTSSPLLLVGLAAMGALDRWGLMSDVRLAAGASRPGPHRLTAAERLLNGRRPGPKLFRSVARSISETITTHDAMGTQVDFESAVFQNLVIKALFDLFPFNAS